MTDNTGPSHRLAQRTADEGQARQEARPEASSSQSEGTAKPKSRQHFDAAWKYHWYIFRYYHFKVADTIDLYASAACLWVINLYLRLFMGIGPEPPSALSEE